MKPSGIHFQTIGIDQKIGELVLEGVDRFISHHPNEAIDIREISEAVGYSGETVKRVLYLLLSLRFLKASFLPRHRICGRVIGEQEISAEVIQEKATEEEFGDFCILCGEPIEGPQDIETQIVFWRPGVDVK
jgi:hypothetical protein